MLSDILTAQKVIEQEKINYFKNINLQRNTIGETVLTLIFLLHVTYTDSHFFHSVGH